MSATSCGLNAGTYNNSTAIGSGATITASNQIMLGTASETVTVPGALRFATAATGTTYKPLAMSDNPILLRDSSDKNHGLMHGNNFYPNGTSTFGIDGPVLYGFAGGMLGTNSNGTLNTALTWKTSGNVGIGTTNPQAALDVSGAIRVSGGITTTYSTLPTFTSGQVGEIKQNTFSYTVTSGGIFSSSLSLTPGVWYMLGQSYITGNSNSYTQASIATNNGFGDTAQAWNNYPTTGDCFGQVSSIVTVASTTTYYYAINPTNGTIVRAGFFKAVRIA